MQRLRTVTSLDVSAVAGHHAMPAALLFVKVKPVLVALSIKHATCIKQACIHFLKKAHALKGTCIKQAPVLSKQNLFGDTLQGRDSSEWKQNYSLLCKCSQTSKVKK